MESQRTTIESTQVKDSSFDSILGRLDLMESMIKELRQEILKIKDKLPYDINPQSYQKDECSDLCNPGDVQTERNQQQVEGSALKEEETKHVDKISATTSSVCWPKIDWTILKNLSATILQLPEFDFTEGVSTVSIEAYKAGAHSIFRCYQCKNLNRGCNLVRCELGHLLCQDCLTGLNSKTEGTCLYYICTCSKQLQDAFGDNNQKIRAVWGYGVRRRLGRQKALNKRDFTLVGKHLDCQ